MHTLIIKNGAIVYVDPVSFGVKGTWNAGSFDPTTRTDNAESVQVESLPDFFMPACWLWEEGMLQMTQGYAEQVFPRLKAIKLAEINTACQRALEALTPTYPERELTTFDKQEQEARAWLKDDTVPTPFLSALAAGRGIELSVLVGKVIARADAFAVASGSIIGQRQELEDRLDACTTVEEVEALAVTITMPGAEAGA